MHNELNAAASCLAFFERAVAKERQLAAARERARIEMRSAIKRMAPKLKPQPKPAKRKQVEYKVDPTPEQLAILEKADAERWTLKRLAAALGWSVSKVWTVRTERDHARKTKRLRAHRNGHGPGNGKPPPDRPHLKYGRRGVIFTDEQIAYWEQAIATNTDVEEIAAKLGISKPTAYEWRLYHWHDPSWIRRYMAEAAAMRAAREELSPSETQR